MGNACGVCISRGCICIPRKDTYDPDSMPAKTELDGNAETTFDAIPAEPEKVGDATPEYEDADGAPEEEIPVILRALYSYEKQNPDDLSFRKDDKMYLIGDSENDWWHAQHIVTKEEGYIPSNYVRKIDGRPQSHESWFDLPRRECLKHLLMPGNPAGTYISRPSSKGKCFALSIRNKDPDSELWSVKHYLISVEKRGYYIKQPTLIFATYDELIDYYKENSGLCQKLTNPCPRVYKPPINFREMIQPKAAFRFGDKLGHGFFGDVYKAKWNNSWEVAIKTMKSDTGMSKDQFLREAKIMHKLQHVHILPLLGVCTASEEDESIYIVTELMSKGSLLKVLRDDEERKSITLEKIVDMAAQIADGLAFLEKKNMVHRDIRADNILVGDDYLCKIADFGLAQFKSTMSFTQGDSVKFPILWTGPEATSDPTKFTIKSDVWSFGIVLWEMCSLGKRPYPGQNPRMALDEIKNGYRMPKPHDELGQIKCPESLYDIMLKCWRADPDERPTFAYMADFFDNYAIDSESDYEEQKQLRLPPGST